MKFRLFFLGLFLLMTVLSFGQTSSKGVLFTIDDKPFYTDEFSRVYKKNLDLVKDESQKDLNQYLELFIGYKLKVNKAYAEGLEKNPSYQRELKSYRTQLAKNYFNDTKITQELLEEGYSRLQKEVKASHILILVDENASPEDTLKGYKKIEEIRKKALTGVDFNDLALQYSEDPSAKENKGDLGYFTAFRMVYPFECAGYTTPKGNVSKIIRTSFGYHILKINDIRNNRGEVTVAHILVLNPKEDDTDQDKSKNRVNDIYKKIQQGEKFEDLAQQFSDDKSTSSKGGVLNRFGSGQLSSDEFENVAFSLENPNDISAPFQSQFGWHIVKLIEKHPVKTFEEMKRELESKVSKDSRSKKIVASLNEKLRKKYTFKKDKNQFILASKLVTDKVYEEKWELPEKAKDLTGTILVINAKKVAGKEFLDFVLKKQKEEMSIKPLSRLLDVLFDRFVDEQLSLFYDENLENEFPEFANVMSEYRDGLLLFDLMEKEIWERSKTDTIGLKAFYEMQKTKHLWKKRIDVSVFSSTKMDVMKKVLELLKKKATIETIQEKLNGKEEVNVMVNSGTFEEGNDALPKGIKYEVGVSDVFKEGDYYFVTKIDKLLPEGVKTFEECKGKIVNDYQQYLEQHWVDNLKKEFSVKINSDVFEQIKKELKQ